MTKSENLELATDCLKFTIVGREDILRDGQKIAAVRSWLDSRADLWVENFLYAPDQDKPLIMIRGCNQPAGTSDTLRVPRRGLDRFRPRAIGKYSDQEYRRRVGNAIGDGALEWDLKDRLETQTISAWAASGRHLLRNGALFDAHNIQATPLNLDLDGAIFDNSQ